MGQEGEPIWRAPINGHFLGEPSADDERIYLAILTTLLALDQRTGERVWAVVPAGSEIQTATLPLVDGQIYILNGSAVHTYDPRTGVRIRTSPLEPRIGLDLWAVA